MERGREIFFSLNILKEKAPPSLRRYADERERTRWKLYKGKQVPHKPWRCLVSRRWLFGFSPSFYFFFSLFSSYLSPSRRVWRCVRCSARSMSIACVYARVCVCCACMHERNVDHCTIGCVNSVQGSGNHVTRDSPTPLVRRGHGRSRG